MDRFSMNEMTTYRWSFDEDVRQYVAAQIPAIGIWRQKLTDFGEEKGIELLSEEGLQVSSLLWAGGFTGSEGRTHKESIEDAEDAIRQAAAVRADCLVIYTGARGGHTQNHARRLIVGALSHLSELAADQGVTLAIEPMHAGCAADWTFLTDLNSAIDVIEAVGSEHVKVVFDTYHLGHNDVALTRLPKVANRVGIVHLGDARQPPRGEQNRCRLNEGTLPLKEIIMALTEGGYGGWYDVELMGEEIEMQDYVSLLAHSKKAFADLMQSARL